VIFARVSSLLVSAVLLICGFLAAFGALLVEVAEIVFAGNSIPLKLH
jgi:hypothetical protein